MPWLLANETELRVISTILAILGGLVALWSFVARNYAEIRSRRQDTIDTWLRGAIHDLFHEAEQGQLTFEDINNSLSREAITRLSELRLRAGDLTAQKVRLLMVTLIEKGVVEQLANNHYQLKFAQTNPTQDIVLLNTRAGPELEDILRTHPGGLALADIRAQLRKRNFEMDRFQVQGLLVQLQQIGLAAVNDAGRWYHIEIARMNQGAS